MTIKEEILAEWREELTTVTLGYQEENEEEVTMFRGKREEVLKRLSDAIDRVEIELR